MLDHISSNSQSPIQKFQEKLKNPKNFQKPQNLGLKCMNAWKGRKLEHLPSVLILISAKNAVSEEIWEWESWERKFSIKREMRKWKLNHALAIYRKTQLDGSRSYWDLSSTKHRHIWIC